MKKRFLLLLVFTSFSSFSQTDFSKVARTTPADFKAAEKSVLEASNYVLSTPLDSKDTKRAAAVKLIRDWEVGTEDYSFIIEEDFITAKISPENKDLPGIYLASMAKTTLEDPKQNEDVTGLSVKAIKAMVAYAEKPANKVEMTPAVKKLVELNKKGELDKLFQQ
ncbi:MAG: hypothetical protein M0D53_00270 [Flavobacterium sp. JAD_PAG50586_2]|nr:MAG: hypothetical protein M0D53_00270 [Flavobacterium sp. JAD_PAG50586_2]